MKLSELLYKQFIQTIDRSETSVGIEIELPIVPFVPGCVSESLSSGICEKLMTMGFSPAGYTNSGKICEMTDEDGNSVSYETSWNTIEFSLHNKRDLLTLYNKYAEILVPLQSFCMERGHFLCGVGINPNYRYMNAAPIDTDILLAKSDFLARYTEHHDGEIFHALCASVQTHLDALDKQSFLKMFRLLRKAYVCDALFFANSLPPDEEFIKSRPALRKLEHDTMCYRDEIWKYCGAPNTHPACTKLETTDDYLKYLRSMKLFVTVSNGRFEAIEPVLLDDYRNDSSWDDEMLTCFRILEPVAPTKRGTVEIRSTCVQPLDAMLEPAAFYTGLVNCADEAEKIIDETYERYFPGLQPPQIRELLMRRSDTERRQRLRESADKLLEASVCGLKKRGFGEEKLLEDLAKRLKENGLRVPAECTEDDALTQTKHQMEKIERKYF